MLDTMYNQTLKVETTHFCKQKDVGKHGKFSYDFKRQFQYLFSLLLLHSGFTLLFFQINKISERIYCARQFQANIANQHSQISAFSEIETGVNLTMRYKRRRGT